MTTDRFYVTTSIPYVNGTPHLGFALELVQADVLARHRRLRGQRVRSLTGTDDNALKNVTAAQAAGVPVQDFVDRNAARFADLRGPLALSLDDFIRTSTDPRHRRGVEALWRRCATRGDFYRKRYEGLYCAGCEHFYSPDELPNGVCPEHGVAPERIAEENWFFRLSRYQERLLKAVESAQVRIEPATKRNEVLALIRAGLADFSVSRPAARSGGWGIAVPGDPGQVIYVWWDALTNYVTALDVGADAPEFQDWWVDAAERVHVIGKGIIRFHAVYWLALLLSAELRLPSAIFVHDYLSTNGAKISKSTGGTVHPEDVIATYGADALRWWFVREAPRIGDTDFTVERLVDRYDSELANGLGNLVSRVLTQVHKFRDGTIDLAATDPAATSIVDATKQVPKVVDAALHRFDLRGATDAIWSVVDAGNRLVDAERPWDLARAEREGDHVAGRRLDGVLTILVESCRVIAHELTPFIPDGAARLTRLLGSGSTVAAPEPAFPRLTSERDRRRPAGPGR